MINIVNGAIIEYSKVVFARGIVCYNTNNHNKCVVLDGNRGTANDRCSKTLEYSHDGLFINTPPNRALIPTGEFIDISQIESVLNNG